MSDLILRPVEQDDRDALRRRISRLEGDLEAAREGMRNALRKMEESQESLINLRRFLAPLYSSLQQVFGELDDAGVGDTAGKPTQANGAWETWKQKLGGKKAAFIQAMLDCGHPMTSTQLRISTHTGVSTVPQVLYELKKLGLVEKNDGKYSLKAL